MREGTASLAHCGSSPTSLPTQDIVGSHPPNHVLAALEHLALENTLQMQELTSRIDIPRDVEALKWVPLRG